MHDLQEIWAQIEIILAYIRHERTKILLMQKGGTPQKILQQENQGRKFKYR